MSLEVHTQGSYIDEIGTWSYTIQYLRNKSKVELIHSESGQATGSTNVQMKLMAILKALTYVRALDPVEPITIKSDCALCIKCITREFDCTNDDAFKREKVTRGFVQYLQEIWWKCGDLNIQFVISS